MRTSLTMLGGLALALGSVTNAGAQQPTPYMYDYCLKVHPGKAAEFAAELRDVGSKLGQVAVDSGRWLSWGAGRAIAPAGESARCDYHIFIRTAGFPAEPPLTPPTEADLKKAGVAMSVQQVLDRRQSLARVVSVNLWQSRAIVGQVEQGNYLRLNYYKAGNVADWAELETTGWKGLVEEASKDMPGLGWGAGSLVMPGGTSQPYNASTYDVFPTWEAFGKGIPTRKYWSKAHPDTDISAYITRINAAADRVMVDVIKAEYVIRKR